MTDSEDDIPRHRIFAICAGDNDNPAIQALLRASTEEGRCFGGVWTIACLRRTVVEHLQQREYQDAAATLAYLCLLVEEGEADEGDDDVQPDEG